jgi:hypothetical protein
MSHVLEFHEMSIKIYLDQWYKDKNILWVFFGNDWKINVDFCKLQRNSVTKRVQRKLRNVTFHRTGFRSCNEIIGYPRILLWKDKKMELAGKTIFAFCMIVMPFMVYGKKLLSQWKHLMIRFNNFYLHPCRFYLDHYNWKKNSAYVAAISGWGT